MRLRLRPEPARAPILAARARAAAGRRSARGAAAPRPGRGGRKIGRAWASFLDRLRAGRGLDDLLQVGRHVAAGFDAFERQAAVDRLPDEAIVVADDPFEMAFEGPFEVRPAQAVAEQGLLLEAVDD